MGPSNHLFIAYYYDSMESIAYYMRVLVECQPQGHFIRPVSATGIFSGQVDQNEKYSHLNFLGESALQILPIVITPVYRSVCMYVCIQFASTYIPGT